MQEIKERNWDKNRFLTGMVIGVVGLIGLFSGTEIESVSWGLSVFEGVYLVHWMIKENPRYAWVAGGVMGLGLRGVFEMMGFGEVGLVAPLVIGVGVPLAELSALVLPRSGE